MSSNDATSYKPQATNPNSALVSIIIPAYNTAQYLHRAIESSLRQTYTNIEVIVVDDGSTDETLSVARKYEASDERVRVFTQENGGVSVARNHAMSEAKGEYFTFLDSDDWLEDEAVEILLDAQMKYPDFMPNARCFKAWYDEAARLFYRARYKPYIQGTEFQAVSVTEALQNSRTLDTGWMITKLFAADKLRQHNIEFARGIKWGEDELFSFEYLCRMNGEVRINKFIYNYYDRPDSAIKALTAEKVYGQPNIYKLMLKIPGLSDEVKKLVRIGNTRSKVGELCEGLAEGWVKDKLIVLRKEARENMREYLNAKGNPDATLLHKILLCGVTLLPIPLARITAKIFLNIRNRKRAGRKRDPEVVEASFLRQV